MTPVAIKYARLDTGKLGLLNDKISFVSSTVDIRLSEIINIDQREILIGLPCGRFSAPSL